jgi:hypothetical protein
MLMRFVLAREEIEADDRAVALVTPCEHWGSVQGIAAWAMWRNVSSSESIRFIDFSADTPT